MSTLLGEKRKDRKTYIAERDRQIYERRNKRTHTQNKENTGVKEKNLKKGAEGMNTERIITC